MKKSILFVGMLFMLLSANTTNAQIIADNYVSYNIETLSGVERADVITIEYRLHNGKLQYRHWNATQGKWVEPDWIDLS